MSYDLLDSISEIQEVIDISNKEFNKILEPILKEKPNWLENLFICKVWKANYAMNQNESQYQFALDWGLKTKYVKKPHYCSMTDRDHKIFREFEQDKNND